MESKELKQFVLTLSFEEAKWLRGQMQNPLGCTPDEEYPEDKEMRHRFFSAVESARYMDDGSAPIATAKKSNI